MTYKRANGTGSVYKLSGRRQRPWIAIVTSGWSLDDAGNAKQQKHILGTYRTRNEGLIALAEYNKNPYLTDHANMTLKEVYEYWLEHCQNRAETTMHGYKTAFNSIHDLHDKIYRTIIAADVEQILQEKSYDNQKRIIGLFKQLDKTAVKLDIPIKNIHMNTDLKKEPTRREKHIFTEDEIDVLWKNSDDPRVQIILIYIYMGWRKTEFEIIKKASVDLDNWTIKGGMKTNAGKNRTVPIHTRIRPFIQSLYEQAPDNGFLYQVNGKQVSDMRIFRLFNAVMDELKMKHSCHEARHTFRTRLFNAGVNTLIIDKLCGHISGSTGDTVYTHISVEQLSEAIKKLR